MQHNNLYTIYILMISLGSVCIVIFPTIFTNLSPLSRLSNSNFVITFWVYSRNDMHSEVQLYSIWILKGEEIKCHSSKINTQILFLSFMSYDRWLTETATQKKFIWQKRESAYCMWTPQSNINQKVWSFTKDLL